LDDETTVKNYEKTESSDPNSQPDEEVYVPPRITHGELYPGCNALQEELESKGIRDVIVTLAIDYTKSNESNGFSSFEKKSLHTLSDKQNFYETSIRVICETVEPFDHDKSILVFGFGDSTTRDKGIFPLHPPGSKGIQGYRNVLNTYRQVTPNVKLLGPTCFAPIIREAINISKANPNKFQILVIICDGEVDEFKDTIESIVKASSYPIGIICIGVGDGPWSELHELDDRIPKRKFDNFQFTEYSKYRASDHRLATACFAEIPTQFRIANTLGIMGGNGNGNENSTPNGKVDTKSQGIANNIPPQQYSDSTPQFSGFNDTQSQQNGAPFNGNFQRDAYQNEGNFSTAQWNSDSQQYDEQEQWPPNFGERFGTANNGITTGYQNNNTEQNNNYY